jgi:hypothetical protein
MWGCKKEDEGVAEQFGRPHMYHFDYRMRSPYLIFNVSGGLDYAFLELFACFEFAWRIVEFVGLSSMGIAFLFSPCRHLGTFGMSGGR